MTECIFCKIIKGEIPGKFVHRDENIVAFYDISPKAPVHVLVLPVKHMESMKDLEDTDKDMAGQLMIAVKKIAEKLNIAEEGYKVVINNGSGAGQLVFHLHIHLLGGWRKSPNWQV